MDPTEKILTQRQFWQKLHDGHTLTINGIELRRARANYEIYYEVDGAVRKRIVPNYQDALITLITMVGNIDQQAS